MLLVDDREAELVEGGVFFRQRMRADDDARSPTADQPLGVRALARSEAAGEQLDVHVAPRGEQLAQ